LVTDGEVVALARESRENCRMKSPMTILVTGCAGFIGSKVGEELIQNGHRVVGVDDLNRSYDVRLKEWRLSQLHGKSNFTFRRCDIVQRQILEELFRTHAFDAVINLAARAGVRQSLENPWVYFETNVTGALNLLELCHTFGVPKFVQASTSSLYGDAPRPFQEDQSTDRPLSPYAASKKAAEALCYTYHELYELDVTVLRYFTVYGPAGRPDMSIFRFVQRIAEGGRVPLYGDGSQERDFTYVDDIARGTFLALQPMGYEIINLGSDRPVTVRQVIAVLEELLRRPAHLEHLPAHPADVPATWADVAKALRMLGWTPKTSLEEGLRNAVRWYVENRSWASEIEIGG
jgi:UDP-glucuronate 4-epimerase